MADVFDGVKLERHTGLGPMSVVQLRDKYGPALTFAADPVKFRITRAWERSQVQVITLFFQNNNGSPLAGVKGKYFWPGNPDEGVEVISNDNGNIDWAFSAPSFYDPPSEVGPYTFKADGLTITGMGSPSKNHPYNHDSMSFDIVVNPSGPPPPPPPSSPDIKGHLDAAMAELAAARALLP